jgi:hypothetical protein
MGPFPTAHEALADYRSSTFVGLLLYSAIGYYRARKAAQRGVYAPALNPTAPTPTGYYPQHHGAPPYQQSTEYHAQTGTHVELPNSYLPPYQSGAATDYYQQQPVKPAHMV